MNLKDKNKIISILLIVLSFALIIFLYKYNLKDNQSTSNLIAIIFVQFICAVMGLTLFIATTNEILKTQKNEIKRYGVRKYLAHITITILNSAYNICVTSAAIVYGAVSIFYSYLGLAIVALYIAMLIEYNIQNKSRIFEAIVTLIYKIFNFPIMLINAIKYVEIKRENIKVILLGLGGLWFGLFTINFLLNLPNIYECLSANGIDSFDSCYKGIKYFLARDSNDE